MKQLLLFILIGLQAVAGPLTVRNGAGINEFAVTYYLENLPQELEACAKSAACQLNNSEAKLAANLKQKLTQKLSLIFLTEDDFRVKNKASSRSAFLLIDQTIYADSHAIAVSDLANVSLFADLVAAILQLSDARIAELVRKLKDFSRNHNLVLSMKSEGQVDIGWVYLPDSKIYFVDNFNSYEFSNELQRSLCPEKVSGLQLQNWQWAGFRGEGHLAFVSVRASVATKFVCQGQLKHAHLQMGVILELQNGTYLYFLQARTDLRYKMQAGSARFLISDVW